MSVSNTGDGCDDTQPSAHVGSVHVERQSISAVHAASLVHADSSALHDESTHVVHGSLPSKSVPVSSLRPVSKSVSYEVALSYGTALSVDGDESSAVPESLLGEVSHDGAPESYATGDECEPLSAPSSSGTATAQPSIDDDDSSAIQDKPT